MNYKSGDLVKITGNHSGHWFKTGETVRLKYRVCIGWAAEHLDRHDWWNVRESDMAPAKPATMPQKIIITADGKTTLARLFDGKTMVKGAEAKCAPSDVFDFGVGAELAVKRLMGEEKPTLGKPATEPVESEPVKLYCVKSYRPDEWLTKGKIYELDADGKIRFDDGYSTDFNSIGENALMKSGLVPLVRRPAKVGEWVYITNASDCNRRHQLGVGDIIQIAGEHRVDSDGYIWGAGLSFSEEDGGCDYLVLDGFKGDQNCN